MRLEITDMRTVTDETPDVRDLEFRGRPVTIGSHSKNLVQLPDVQLAAHHATIELVGDDWYFQATTRDDTHLVVEGTKPGAIVISRLSRLFKVLRRHLIGAELALRLQRSRWL